MTLIESIKAFFLTYSELKANAPLWVNHLSASVDAYGIVPVPTGSKIISQDLAGNSDREYIFAFQSMESTADEAARISNSGWFEALDEWLEEQSLAGNLPALDPTITSKTRTAEKIEALEHGYLEQQGQSNTGIYQALCKLTYHQHG